MTAACGACRSPRPKLGLHRIGHRLLCRSCFIALRKAPEEGAPVAPLLPTEVRSLERLTAGLAYAGLIAKAGVFVLFFLWAARSPTGAAALQGAVIADVFTWVLFSLLEWHFRGFQIRVGAVFEAALLLFYTLRGEIFDIPTTVEGPAVAFLFFLLFASVKMGVWAAELALEVSGVKEPG